MNEQFFASFRLRFYRLKRDLQNSLRGANSMIAKPVWSFATRHNLLGLRQLAKNQIGTVSANLRPNGFLQAPLNYLGFLIGVLCFSQGYSTDLWWNDPGCGDIMEMMIYVSNTAPTTYFETLGWNQGVNGGGYTGIQTDNNMNPLYIFSLWNPTTTSAIVQPVYVNPAGTATPFGGEGVGLHYLNSKTGWKLNHWYRQVVRAWPYNGHTYYGMWTYDVSAQQWMHHATFDFPVANMNFCPSAVSFLENWSGTQPSALRHASLTGGWKRFKNQFVPLNSAGLDGSLTGYGEEIITSYPTIFMQTGTATSNQSSTLKINFNIPPFTVNMTNPYIQTQNMSINSGLLTYSWTVDISQNPPFAYKVILIDETTNTTLATQQDINPEARSVQFCLCGINTPIKNLAIQATITDIYDVTHTALTPACTCQ